MFFDLFRNDLTPNSDKLAKIEEVISLLETSESIKLIDGPRISTLYNRKNAITSEFLNIDFSIDDKIYWVTLKEKNNKASLSVTRPTGVDDEEEFVKQSCPVSVIDDDDFGNYKELVALIKRFEIVFDIISKKLTSPQ